MNLLDCGVKVAAHYFQAASDREFIRRNEFSFRIAFLLAFSFARILSKVSQKLELGESPMHVMSDDETKTNFLVDGETTRTQIITSHTLRLTKAKFDVMNDYNGPNNMTVVDNIQTDSDNIESDEKYGAILV